MGTGKYIAAVFIGSCSYGILSTIVKFSYEQGISPSIVIVSQFVIGWILMLSLQLLITNQPRLRMKQAMLLMLAGIPTGLVGVFYYLSLARLDASIGIILLFQFAWLGVLLNSIVKKVLPSKKTIISLVLLILGTVLASDIGGNFNLNPLGVILGLLAAVSYTLFVFLNDKLLPELHPAQRSFYMVSGSLITVLVVFAYQLFDIINQGHIQFSWTNSIFLGLFGVVIPPFLFAYGMPHIGSSMGSILGAAELPVAVICSIFILNEQVTVLQQLGVLIIFLAIIIANVRFAKRKTIQEL
ncbi:EamA family transporter [Pseudalkalibacillus decolorationis]|uniref:EamA family transporter n=1 Tax=Pseudalkalibacillus decolorationis TaxID=163879 RepID=UPI002148A060|nr:DMT family transporter [Pseudalkalibacillus decolorationis]